MLAIGGWAWAVSEHRARRATAAEVEAGRKALALLGATMAEKVRLGGLALADRDRVISQHLTVISQLQGTLARRPVRLHQASAPDTTPRPLADAPVPDLSGCLASLEACRRGHAALAESEPEPCPTPATVELGMGCFAQQIEAAPGQVAALLYGWAEAATGGLIAKRPDQDDSAEGIIEVDGRRMEPLAQVTFKRTEQAKPPLRRMLELRGGVTTGAGFAAGASWYGARRVGWWAQGEASADDDRIAGGVALRLGRR